ncbi:hypothetical protein KIW84_034550 [Lathyrus oleraceus]|uniref:MULE transposase domain-containing protein n=1 Tax=Pisum sativum TaxID=3888 RepID=A0A9D5B5C5_PEA|nr:hypothetical protein KIW84_034550 [Pisum sativum]
MISSFLISSGSEALFVNHRDIESKLDGGDVDGHEVMQANYLFISDGCLNIFEYDNTIVDEDSEFEEVEYGDKEVDEDGEFDGGEYHDEDADESLVVDDVDDIAKMDMFNLQNDDVSKLKFESLEIAYKCYCWFAKMNVLRQDRVKQHKHGPKHETRCGCGAKFWVHIDIISHRWYVTVYSFEHNHEMLKEKHCMLLATNRKLSQSDKIQIKNFGNAGIKVTQMIGAFANVVGGYDKVGFLKKDVHNQILRQRKEMSSDAKGDVRYLIYLCVKDPLMFVTHMVGADKTMQNLFWSDGESQKNYELFGDVLSFDATYNKNKYRCPFVVFTVVNHHNQTIIFATAIVSNEVEGTYVGLLEQFLVAMKVSKYRDERHGWQVSHCPSNNDFTCRCLRMESIGIPFGHIVDVMVYIDIVEFPKTLVLNRWSLFAKESVNGIYQDGSHYWDSHLVVRHVNLVNLSKEVVDLSYMDVDDYKKYIEYLTTELNRLKSKYDNEDVPENIHVIEELENILNPSCSKSKGYGPSTVGTLGKRRRTQTCGICGAAGHNRRCCATLGADG